MASNDATNALMELMKLLRLGVSFEYSLKRAASRWGMPSEALRTLYNGVN